MIKKNGAIIVSVAYWMDEIYSTNTIVIVKLKFDEFMEDYDDEGVPNGRGKPVSIIFSKIPIRKKTAGDDKTIVYSLLYAQHITKPICLVY